MIEDEKILSQLHEFEIRSAPFIAGSVEDAWARCSPIWREHGRIEDKPRGVSFPIYVPWWGKRLAEEFAFKFRDDYRYIIGLLPSPDPFIAIAAVELLDYMSLQFDEATMPDVLFQLSHPLPPILKAEVESCLRTRDKSIHTVGELLRFEHQSI